MVRCWTAGVSLPGGSLFYETSSGVLWSSSGCSFRHCFNLISQRMETPGLLPDMTMAEAHQGFQGHGEWEG
ncbi:hypothetical protein GN956_G5193 [Arapaima gigas]